MPITKTSITNTSNNHHHHQAPPPVGSLALHKALRSEKLAARLVQFFARLSRRWLKKEPSSAALRAVHDGRVQNCRPTRQQERPNPLHGVFFEDRIREDDEETMVTSVADDSAPSITVPDPPLNSPAASYAQSIVSDMDSKVRALTGKLESLSSHGPTPPTIAAREPVQPWPDSSDLAASCTISDCKTASAERVTAVLPLFPYGLIKNPTQSWLATPDNHPA